MTPSPHSVGREQPLEVANAIMRRYGIQHLPVLEGGKLAGVLSQRDVRLVASLPGVDPRDVTVDEAMSREASCVRPEATVVEVAQEMASYRYGCAVVMDDGKVSGVFTTTDAVRLLAERLTKG